MKQSRWRSKVAWSAAVLILFVLNNYGLLEPLITDQNFKECCSSAEKKRSI